MGRGATAEDRIRQAEQDAARAREIAEEDQLRRERSVLPSMTKAEAMAISATMVRQYVRAAVIEPVIGRLYNIGMGIEKFDGVAGGSGIVIIRYPIAA